MLGIGLKISAVSVLAMAAYSNYSPESLFANGEQGVWYDPSDFTTMFQDAAGTTPVTAVEQPVGLILDKSKGLVLGSNTATSFSVGADWTWNGSTLTALGTAGGTAATSSTAVAAGSWYKVTYTVTRTSGLAQVRIGNSFIETVGSSGTRTFYILTGNTTGLSFTSSGAFLGTITAISAVAVPGNHASQSTSASRPVLSARVNMLTRTEDFSNAVWQTLGGVSSSAPVHSDPLGGTKACLLAETTGSSVARFSSQSVAFASGVSYTLSVAMKKGSGVTAPDWMQLTFPSAVFGTSQYANFNIYTGEVGTVVGGTASITSLGSGFYRCTFTASATSTASGLAGVIFNNNSNSSGRVPSYVGATTSNVFVWGADLRVTNVGVGLPAYQRVGAATDYNTTGFPYYLAFDGTDDSLATASIDFSATDKMSVFAGVRKLSDAAGSAVAELSANAGSNNGAFALFAPLGSGTPGFGFRGRGSVSVDAATSSPVSPVTSALSGLGDISGDRATLRVNGTQAAQSTADQGTGNYGNYPLYIGSRGGSSLRFNGRLYSLLIRGAASTDAQIASAEAWVNGKTKAF